MANKIALILGIFCLGLAMFLLLVGVDFSNQKEIPRESFTIEESQSLVEEYIFDLYPYRELNGGDITQTGKGVLECDSCYSFKYKFEVDSQKMPGEREFAEVEIEIENGNIVHTHYSENLIVSKTFCVETQRNVEFCTMEYAPVCGYDSEENKIKTYSNPCFACSDSNVFYYISGEC